MTVYVYFPDLSQPIIIDQAIVRWADGLEFGVELTRMSLESAARLSDYLSAHCPAPELTLAHAISPFSYN